MAVAPPRWSDAELEYDSQFSIESFRDERMKEPLELYLEAFDKYRGVMEDLLEMTVDLTKLEELAVDVLTDVDMLEAVRYLAGPAISADDLKVLAETTLAPGRLRADPPAARRIIDTVLLGLDRRRFPWVTEDREPTEAERTASALASAALIASRRVMTSRAHDAKNQQEDAVEAVLMAAPNNFEKVASRAVSNIMEAPLPGQFCREGLFGDRKADLIVRLRDGRAMPIECKVSNSSTNSVKRLNNDAAVKASAWIDQFGSLGCVPTAVLGGVFKVHNLKAAQRGGLTLFWAHGLDKLTKFLVDTSPRT